MSSGCGSAAWTALGPGWTLNGSAEQRYPGNLNLRREGLDAARLIGELRDARLLAGLGLRERLGPPEPCASRARPRRPRGALSIRLGFGRYTSEEELVEALGLIGEAARAQGDLAA